MDKKRINLKRDLISVADLFDDVEFAQEVYSALCNMIWRSLKDSTIEFTCSWRYAGSFVADIRNLIDNTCCEDYLHYYCSGREGRVTNRVKELLFKLGWEPVHYPDETEDREKGIST